jgi:hypothetical protein
MSLEQLSLASFDAGRKEWMNIKCNNIDSTDGIFYSLSAQEFTVSDFHATSIETNNIIVNENASVLGALDVGGATTLGSTLSVKTDLTVSGSTTSNSLTVGVSGGVNYVFPPLLNVPANTAVIFATGSGNLPSQPLVSFPQSFCSMSFYADPGLPSPLTIFSYPTQSVFGQTYTNVNPAIISHGYFIVNTSTGYMTIPETGIYNCSCSSGIYNITPASSAYQCQIICSYVNSAGVFYPGFPWRKVMNVPGFGTVDATLNLAYQQFNAGDRIMFSLGEVGVQIGNPTVDLSVYQYSVTVVRII